MISSVPEFQRHNFDSLYIYKTLASTEILLMIVATRRRRRCGRPTGRKLEFDVRRGCYFGVLLATVVVSFNSHFRLHDDALKSGLVCVDCDAISLDVLRAILAVQVVVVDSRKVLLTFSTVTYISISIALVGERGS